MAYEGLSQSHLQNLAGPNTAPGRKSMSQQVQENADDQYAKAQQAFNIQKNLRNSANARTLAYMDKIPDGVELGKLGLNNKYQGDVQEWSKGQQMKAAQYAEAIATAEQNGDFKTVQAYKSELSKIENAFVTVNNNLENFKSYKSQYIQDSDSGNLSNANSGEKLDLLSNVYTDQMNMSFDDSGNITFVDPETSNYISFDDLPSSTSKNNKGATSILEMNEGLFKGGQRLTNSKRLLLKNKLKGLTTDRDELLSLATDDFIIDGGLGIKDMDLLYNKERTSELRDKVVGSYMDIFNESANSGYTQNQSRATRRSGGSSLSAQKYNATMNNINQGFNLLSEGNTEMLNRVIKGDLVEDEENPGSYYYIKGNVLEKIDPSDPNSVQNIYLHEGIPQNYWGKPSSQADAASSSENPDVNFYMSQLD